MSNVKIINSENEFAGVTKSLASGMAVLHFGAKWSLASNQVNDMLNNFTDLKNISFVYLDCEKFPKIAMRYKITGVPTLIFMKNNETVKVLKGGNPKELKEALLNLPKIEFTVIDTKPEDLDTKLKRLISTDKIMLFMKGNPSEPKCGFSRKIIEILNGCNAVFKSFDILTDNEVREGLKKFSNWPTYPQLYINGELVGGLDIVQEMNESGDLLNLINGDINNQKEDLETRLKSLIKKGKVVLFMKGHPDSPKCGFSRNTVEILRRNKVEFQHFDILSDEEVRQGLKEFSKWPTYPQLYCNAELVGGFDIIKELDESGELLSSLE